MTRSVFLLAFSLSLPVVVQSATYQVNPGESVQAAIDSATHGDEVVVLPGRYVETIDFVGKNITVRSATPEDPEAVAATIVLSAAPATDLEGNPRPGSDGQADMGAFESPDQYTPDPAAVSPRVIFVGIDGSKGSAGSSWDTALPSISEALFVSNS